MITIGKHVVAGYSPAGQFLAGQSLAGVMAAVLVLVLAPMGDAMGQAGRHDAVCDHCGGAVVTVSDSFAIEDATDDGDPPCIMQRGKGMLM